MYRIEFEIHDIENKTNLSPAEVLIGPYLGIEDYLKGGKKNPDSFLSVIIIQIIN